MVDKWIGIEREVESTLKEVAPKGDETIIPGAIYVGVAGMGGSILARNRTILFSRADERDVSDQIIVAFSGDWDCGTLLSSRDNRKYFGVSKTT